MKFLILGVNGMVGHTMALYLTKMGHDVVGFAKRPSAFVRTYVGNALDIQNVNELVSRYDGEFIVNCIGILNNHAENNPREAEYINGVFPHRLADFTEGTCKKIIQISTDCVFSGDRGGYLFSDLPDGQSVYAKTKAMGELNDGRNITLRQSTVGPDTNPMGMGLLNWFMGQRDRVFGYRNVIWTGVSSLQLAKTVEAVACCGVHGIFNAVPDCSISKYELLCLFNRYLNGGRTEIVAADLPCSDKSLVSNTADFGYIIPDYEQMMAELGKYIDNNREIYPHYFI